MSLIAKEKVHGSSSEVILPDIPVQEEVDEKPFNKAMKVTQTPQFKVRENLLEYFEVVNEEECKIRCKLAGEKSCLFDGVQSSLKYSSKHGWFGFERHLARRHKILVGAFLKRKKVANIVKTNISRSIGKKLKKKCRQNEDDGITSEFIFTSSRYPQGEVNWESLKKTEKHCIVCRNVCSNSDGSENISFSGPNVIWIGDPRAFTFPGCNDNFQLSQQLFVLFFLKDIIEFPMPLCAKFLTRCKGQLSPETWVNFCSSCKEILMKAADIRRKVSELESTYASIKNALNEKSQISCAKETSSTRDPRNIEEEIKKYIRFSTKLQNKFNQQKNSSMPSTRTTAENKSSFLLESGNETDEFEESQDTFCHGVESKLSHSKRKRESRGKLREPGFYAQIEKTGITVVDENCGKSKINAETEMNDALSICCDDAVQESVPKNEPISPQHVEQPDDDFDVDFSPSSSSDDGGYVPRTTKTAKKKGATNPCKPARNRGSKGKARTRPTKSKRERFSIENDEDGQLKSENTNEYMCELCPSKYTSVRTFKQHVDAHRVSKLRNSEHDCVHCGYPCLTSKALKVHIGIKHRDSSELSCTLCSFVAPSRRLFYDHMNQHRETSQKERVGGKFLCKLCNRLFVSYALLCRHKRIKHHKEIGISPLRCEICTEIFSSTQHLRSHIRQVHEKESRYFCEICGKGFLFMSKLKRHSIAHATERPHICEICGADFQYSETLRKHLSKEHKESEQAKVGDYAYNPVVHDKDFSLSNLSVQHLCKHCGNEFSTMATLCRHLKRDHPERYQHRCDLCDRSYATLQSLRRHKDINHTIHEVPCPYCGKMFSHQEYVRAHFRYCKKHPNRHDSSVLVGEEFDTANSDFNHPSELVGNSKETKSTAVKANVDHFESKQSNTNLSSVNISDSNNSEPGVTGLRIECIHSVRDELVVPVEGYTVVLSTPRNDDAK